MALWITLSAAVIMYNKYILDPSMGGFPFPLTLTAACMPMLVYSIGTLFGTERWSLQTGVVLVVVVGGVLTASYGEMVFVLIGVLYQCASLLSEATRLTMVQLLLQARGIKFNPISTMYYVSPVCFVFLVIPMAVLELQRVLAHPWKLGPTTLVASAAMAFALNCSIYLLIGRSSALTMNIAGVVKDVMLIYLSMALYGSIVTELQVLGYAVALGGVFYYNYQKIIKAASAAAADGAGSSKHSSDGSSDSKGSKDLESASDALHPLSGKALGGGVKTTSSPRSGFSKEASPASLTEADPLVTVRPIGTSKQGTS
eukprot:gene5138-5378_t